MADYDCVGTSCGSDVDQRVRRAVIDEHGVDVGVGFAGGFGPCRCEQSFVFSANAVKVDLHTGRQQPKPRREAVHQSQVLRRLSRRPTQGELGSGRAINAHDHVFKMFNSTEL